MRSITKKPNYNGLGKGEHFLETADFGEGEESGLEPGQRCNLAVDKGLCFNLEHYIL